MKTTKTTWIVQKVLHFANGTDQTIELGRYATKAIATMIACEVGGYVIRYRAE
jgi:hypothetical protein